MTLNTILHNLVEYETSPNLSGGWFVARGLAEDEDIAQLDVLNNTGALVLGCRKGIWNGHDEKHHVELFLWGTPEQLMSAQQRFKLQALIDAELDRPERYWG